MRAHTHYQALWNSVLWMDDWPAIEVERQISTTWNLARVPLHQYQTLLLLEVSTTRDLTRSRGSIRSGERPIPGGGDDSFLTHVVSPSIVAISNYFGWKSTTPPLEFKLAAAFDIVLMFQILDVFVVHHIMFVTSSDTKFLLVFSSKMHTLKAIRCGWSV